MNPEPFSVIEGKYKERKTGRDKEKNDFEKRASILGWIITLALAGVPYLLLAVGIEMVKILFSTVSLLSGYV